MAFCLRRAFDGLRAWRSYTVSHLGIVMRNWGVVEEEDGDGISSLIDGIRLPFKIEKAFNAMLD